MDVADAADSLVARVDAVLVIEIVEQYGALVFPLKRLHQGTFVPGHAAIQPHVDVAHIEGPIGGILSCQQLGCGAPGAGGLDEPREIQMLGATLFAAGCGGSGDALPRRYS